MSEIPTTYYVKSDDVPIAYQVFGEGPFDLLFVPGLCLTSKPHGARPTSPPSSGGWGCLTGKNTLHLVGLDVQGTIALRQRNRRYGSGDPI